MVLSDEPMRARANSDAVASRDSAAAGSQTTSLLPVDPGFTVEAEVAQRFVKGEDIAFCFRADPGLLGRAMAPIQPEDPADWKLNYDVFVVCDGHSGVAVRSEYLLSTYAGSWSHVKALQSCSGALQVGAPTYVLMSPVRPLASVGSAFVYL